MMPAVALIGPGRLGQAVGRLLAAAGYPIRAVISRQAGRAEAAAAFIGAPEAATTELRMLEGCRIVLLTLPDDQLAPLAHQLCRAGLSGPQQVFIHCSGLHPAACVKPTGANHRALSLHPLQTFATPQAGFEALPGTPWSVEGDPAALPLGEALVRDLRGEPFRLEAAQKSLYHAAASVTANYQAALFRVACELFGHCGFSQEEARRLLTPLFVTSSRNIAEFGPERALTGPIARGDLQTVAAQIAALKHLPKEFLQLFKVVGRQAVATARAKGSIDAATGVALREVLSDTD